MRALRVGIYIALESQRQGIIRRLGELGKKDVPYGRKLKELVN